MTVARSFSTPWHWMGAAFSGLSGRPSLFRPTGCWWFEDYKHRTEVQGSSRVWRFRSPACIVFRMPTQFEERARSCRANPALALATMWTIQDLAPIAYMESSGKGSQAKQKSFTRHKGTLRALESHIYFFETAFQHPLIQKLS